MDEAIKHSLLITHGTIYGDIPVILPVKQYEYTSASVVKLSGQVEWRNGLFRFADCLASPVGTMTDNSTIDFHHWSMVGGLGESGLEQWQQCMTLFMRHI